MCYCWLCNERQALTNDGVCGECQEANPSAAEIEAKNRQGATVESPPICYVPCGFLVVSDNEDFYPQFYKQKDHFGAAMQCLTQQEAGWDAKIAEVFIKGT